MFVANRFGSFNSAVLCGMIGFVVMTLAGLANCAPEVKGIGSSIGKQAQEDVAKHTEREVMVDDHPFDKRLRVDMVIGDIDWNDTLSIGASVIITNESAESVKSEVGAIFKLVRKDIADEIERDRATYWCPVDILSGTNDIPNHSSTLSLAPHSTFKVFIILNELKWGGVIYSDWPSGLLFKTVPKGNYYLDFRILDFHDFENPGHGRNPEDGGPIISNRVSIVIR